MDRAEVFDKIIEAIHESNDDFGFQMGYSRPEWIGLAISDIVVAIGDANFRFVNTSVSPNSERPAESEIDIHIFTDDLLLHVHGVRSDVDDTRTTTVRSRKSLRELGVAAGASFDDGRSWPGRLTVQLTYDDGTVVMLPGGRSTNRGQHERLAAFLPSLRADLVG
jgi:hypothetical protein